MSYPLVEKMSVIDIIEMLNALNSDNPPLSRFTSTWTKRLSQQRRLRLLRPPV